MMTRVSPGSSIMQPINTAAGDENAAGQEVQRIIVMRHGRRHDTDHPAWNFSARNPWDTPLSQRGVQEVDKNAPKLNSLTASVIVVSPYLRCMQTAKRLIFGMRKFSGRVIIDRQLSELCDPTLLYQTQCPSAWKTIKHWWWKVRWKERATEILGNLMGCELELPEDRPWPCYPEDKYSGRHRFAQAIKSIGNTYSGNILIVTHGDAIFSAAKLADHTLSVQGVQPGGYIALKRTLPGAGSGASYGLWEPDTSIKWYGVEVSKDMS